jgi:hypothetical protein
MRRLLLTAAAATTLGLALLTGCSSELSQVTLQGSPSVAAASVLVDVVGIGPNSQGLKLLPVSRYWEGGSAPTKADAKSFRFGPNSPQSYTIAPSDPIWKHWHDIGATEVMVVADLPGVFPDLPGDADARRKILPISSKSTTATIVVDRSGLLKSTP